MGKSRQRKKKVNKPLNVNNNSKPKSLDPSLAFERPESNSRIQLTIVPEFSTDDYRQQIPRLPKGSSGIYQVTFVLTIPGKNVFKESLEFNEIMKSGDSLIQLSPQAPFLKSTVFNDDESAEILFLSNSKHRISCAQMRINAPDFISAEAYAYNLIMPQLSYWSFIFNVSLDIAGYEVIEENTQSKKYNFGILGKVKPFNYAGEVVMSKPAYRNFYAAYREGMNATNVFYQALSFYKVAEGLQAERIREQRRTKKPLAIYDNEIFPKTTDEILIHDDSIKILFKPYLGQDFKDVIEHLKNFIRHAIAHLSNLDGVLDPDKFDDFNTCSNAIPVLHYIAHTMLDNESKKVTAKE